ncbi:hypothetical protein [Enterococcus sp. BWR-S5]|uniref:hypothetical protein n=1 Tax=Enterococcus sp. BWR-S5 TaxID=2787714 RepID=UPI0019222972|nr:hypothetical protein [Enterococcus sp. BWR-S5]MBL1225390.1 hypothetical protein [Enterococcus sp. BWR-S5]
MTEQKINVEKLRETARDLRNIKNGIGTTSNKVKMAAFITLKHLNEVIGRLELLEDNQQTFKVGEYYKKDSSFGYIYKVIENSMTEMQSVKFYDSAAGTFKEFTLHEKAIAHDPDATTEEIALFKRAEHFHSKGRKLNEFRAGDLVIADDDYEIVETVESNAIFTKKHGMALGHPFLFMTAEEQEATEVKG